METLLERANVNYAQRSEFRSDPALAVRYLELALDRPNVKKPAAYALTQFRKHYFTPPSIEELVLAAEPEDTAPTLEELELAWSWHLPDAALASIAARITEHGGFRRMIAEAS